MEIIEVKQKTPELIQNLLDVWESSVKKTHLFLSDEEIKQIKNYVPQALEQIAHLIVLKNSDNLPIAFMGIEENTLEMLFVSDKHRGQGLGKQLLQLGIEQYGVNQLTVNEQNPDARGFYEYLNFYVYKRTEVDEDGLPYPLLYMKLDM
ncbi:GNAT family N-acetyltransferase [Enterococcus saccharolyticus]|uniref:Acetyltransferase n=1 Tax=Candidatus Enterococcus willemsii TaxID=1857215 RepID=A0ABQ6Z235_9ENTE|nr:MULTISPECIES: GNAT family N-acetyltransferase [Enterococcus]KAF1305610.1 acetyltransferase [Enterococcus sp. CU12B]MCD5000871.1 GNAT family N-acetyltransferase [Enterococcus saccharolyticus]